ncbi:uncharacterized protein LOC130015681 [Mercurialis annua]|uniref:uncharacterized protein LOC130015681 n=1 Tax=Mercurialis annua TaxID=3986 RepID=UPI0024AD8CA2|nr:uncharacterized protein LOC130015681 [Mercurialis annua]
MGPLRTFNILRDYVKNLKPNVVFLMETRMDKRRMERVCRNLEMEGLFTVDCEGKSGGLALMWGSSGTKVTILGSSKFHIDCFVEDENLNKWRYTGVYGNPVQAQRIHTWTLMNRLRAMFNGPWICGGDFNEILKEEEKEGGAPKAASLIRNFQEALNDCGLVDVGCGDGEVTWWGNRGSGVVKEKLDRFVVNSDWNLIYPDCVVKYLDFWGSDHRPIVLCGKQENCGDRGKRKRGSRFHFEEAWALKAEFTEVVKKEWQRNPSGGSVVDISHKLKRCSDVFKKWDNHSNKGMKREIAARREKLRVLMNAPAADFNFDRVKEMERDLDSLLHEEEVRWKQRARTDWLAHGDKNTRYFQLRATKRRARNQIKGLQDELGIWKEEPAAIEGIIQSYFKSMFESTKPSSVEIDEVLKHVTTEVSGSMNDTLCKRFGDEEIVKALKDMAPTKAPGKDGFPALFYQRYWQVVGKEITEVCLLILNSEIEVNCINETIISLIPKIKNAKCMSHFRPISLCNVLYKIVSKAIANRLRMVLDSIIDSAQSAVVPGRQIIDNALIGFECIHVIKNSRKKKDGMMALKLDMSKAYDRVEWIFVEQMMRKLGFRDQWISKVMRCVSSVQFSFLLNGSVKGKIRAERGLRQGDPLSPYLFLICAQGLSSMINSAVNKKLISGIKFGDGCHISHLFFADDSLLFCKANSQECSLIKEILQVYSKASGQVINMEKSALSFGKGTRPETREEIKSIFNVPEVKCHEKYLGLPSSVGRCKGNSFQSIKDRIWQKLNDWKSSLFSGGGKDVLIRAVVQAIPTYFMNCFKFPKSLIDAIERLCNKFWWGSSDVAKRIHWAKWNLLCRSKCKGGLGFRDLECFNKSLLAKQGWRILDQPESLMARMFKGRYFKNSSFLEAKCPRTASYTWKSIMWGRELLSEGLRWRIGTGENVHIYGDKWVPMEKSFKIQSLPVLDIDAHVVSLMRVQGCWNTELIHASFSTEEAASIISIPLARTRQADRWRWHYDKKGKFTVRSGYHLAMEVKYNASSSDSTGAMKWWKAFWKNPVPLKVNVFLWKCFHNWIPVRLNLQRRGMCIDVSCPNCGTDIESSIHALWFCNEAKLVWNSWPSSALLKPGRSWSLQDFLVSAQLVLSKTDFAVFGVILWLVWHARNTKLFGGDHKPRDQVVQWAITYVDDFRTANEKKTSGGMRREVGREAATDNRWVPPRGNVFAVNVDAGFAEDTFTTGVVIRDWRGEVLTAECSRYEGRPGVDEGEACAIRDGIILATETNLTPFVINSDSKVAVDSFNNTNLPCNSVGLIAQDCLELVKNRNCNGFIHVNRNSNVVAHMLARKAFSANHIRSRWMGHVPPDITRYVLADHSALV